ncbi:MAG: hypothetical protein EPO07_16740 [Verrucomicrobia bacterium]|nr:MAG: hypothetical protein EPO07_16740 [Verrucomicrobiota bacterium]
MTFTVPTSIWTQRELRPLLHAPGGLPAAHPPADSPFRNFIVRCLKCDSYLLRIASAYDKESGQHRARRICTKCGQTEELL